LINQRISSFNIFRMTTTRKILKSFVLQFIFWLLFFNITRALFFIYYSKLIRLEKIPFTEVLKAFPNAFKLDLATTCYLMAFPLILLIVQCIWNPRWFNWINRIYTSILITVYSLIIAGEIGIYAEWKTKLTYKALLYLSHPSEVYNSASTSTFFILLTISIVLISLMIFIYNRFFYRNIHQLKSNYVLGTIMLIVTPPLMLLGARGGIQEIPINQSESYYSNYNIMNSGAVNSVFNLYISIFENKEFFDSNPFIYFPEKEALQTVKELHEVEKDTIVSILTTDRPNIVMIILESWSADLIQSLGGEPGITPEFRKLEKEGILLTQLYSTGTRSEQAMASIFSGFPSHPYTSITVQPDKCVNLPSIIDHFKKEGYFSSYYFAGQLIYGNMKSYILSNNFNRVKEVYDFDPSLPQGKLGIHDEFALNEQLNDLVNDPQPFFSAIFTVSTHSPYDQPMEEKLHWGDNERDYINSAYYTDWCLGEYFKKARKQDWYENTLFILLADHSHNSYRNWNINTWEYHKIPLLFYGNVIKDDWKGKKINKIFTQTDIAGTLLPQLSMDATEFKWSRNMFNPDVEEFAYFCFEVGLAWKRKEGHFIFDHRNNIMLDYDIPESDKVRIDKEGRSYLQVLFDEYISY